MRNRIERYAVAQYPQETAAPPQPAEFPLPMTALDLYRPYSPTTSMQTNPTRAGTVVDFSNTPSKFTGRILHSRDGTVSPGGFVMRHTTGGSAGTQGSQLTQQEGSAGGSHHVGSGAYRDVHLTGSEPRVWPGVISSSVRRQSSMSEMDQPGEH